ncbi:MAG: hypothetical protein ACLP2X_16110, partial [Syntrophobacteraceae bacterium]
DRDSDVRDLRKHRVTKLATPLTRRRIVRVIPAKVPLHGATAAHRDRRVKRLGGYVLPGSTPRSSIGEIKGLAESPLAPFVVLLYWKRLDGLRFRSTHPTGYGPLDGFGCPVGDWK